jgi:hypothetical protein
MDDHSQIVGGCPSPEVRPEEVHDLLAVQAVTRRESEKLHQVCGLTQPPRTLIYGPGAHRDTEAAQQPDAHGLRRPVKGAMRVGGLLCSSSGLHLSVR